MKILDLYLDRIEHREDAGKSVITIQLSRPYDEDLQLWYEIPFEQWDFISLELMDAFVIAALLKSMEDQASLRVHGPVSSSLLDNLEEYQLIFSTWFPDKYSQIEIIAESETEKEKPNDDLILSFSGGVDGAFSALNHILRKGPVRRKRRPVSAILYIEGFDVNIDYDRQLRSVVARNRRLFEGKYDLSYLNVRTNLKYLLSIKRFWISHACVIASAASLFSKSWGGCLVGSSHSYRHLSPWGSHPLTDRLLSSRSFEIHHDVVFTRIEKLQALAVWPEALENLKVCWEGQYKFDSSPDTNCCACDKCVRTMLAFRALGQKIPSSFPEPLTPEKVQNLQYKPFDWSRLMFLKEVMETAEKNGNESDPVFKALLKIIEDHS